MDMRQSFCLHDAVPLYKYLKYLGKVMLDTEQCSETCVTEAAWWELACDTGSMSVPGSGGDVV